MISRSDVSKAIAEAIGTFAIVFFGCGAVVVTAQHPAAVPPGGVPVAFGLVVAVMIYAVGHLSGAHFNPAVTLAFAVARRFPPRQVLIYWVAQVIGAIAASFLLAALLPGAGSYGATVPAVPIWQALAWEVILSFFLMFVIISVATDTRAVGVMAGAAIGATVMLCALVGGPATGASMNPARSLGPALVQAEWSGFWVYAVGPFVGAVLAALTYEAIRCEPQAAGNVVQLEVKPTAKDAKGCC